MSGDSTSASDETIFDEFIETHCSTDTTWVRDKNKKQCPDCSSVNKLEAESCKVCGWKQTEELPVIPPKEN